jgi:hypothetical protein
MFRRMNPMRPWSICLLLVLAAIRPARADPASQFAASLDLKADAVRDVAGFVLPAGGDYTHLLIGRFQDGDYLFGAAVILRCDAKQCTGARVQLAATDRVELYGIIDLNGAPAPLPTSPQLVQAGRYRTLDGGTGKPRPAWPALVLHTETVKQATGESRFRGTVSGTERRGKITIVSLLRADERSPTVLTANAVELYPSGAGTTTTFRTARGDTRDALDIIGTEQRHLDRSSRCLRPEPVEVRYRPQGRRYERVAAPPPRGC